MQKKNPGLERVPGFFLCTASSNVVAIVSTSSGGEALQQR